VKESNFRFAESLKAICEAFVVALGICGLPPIQFICGKCLDRRKSKVINTESHSSGIYLDIVGLPQMTRNVSESQLLSLRNVGKCFTIESTSSNRIS
jgi:hypothetical protein